MLHNIHLGPIPADSEKVLLELRNLTGHQPKGRNDAILVVKGDAGLEATVPLCEAVHGFQGGGSVGKLFSVDLNGIARGTDDKAAVLDGQVITAIGKAVLTDMIRCIRVIPSVSVDFRPVKFIRKGQSPFGFAVVLHGVSALLRRPAAAFFLYKEFPTDIYRRIRGSAAAGIFPRTPSGLSEFPYLLPVYRKPVQMLGTFLIFRGAYFRIFGKKVHGAP